MKVNNSYTNIRRVVGISLLLVMTLLSMVFQQQSMAQTAQTTPLPMLDDVYSSKPLGCMLSKQGATFRLFAPRATSVRLILFAKGTNSFALSSGKTTGREISMSKSLDSKGKWDGAWEHSERGLPESFYGMHYGYAVDGPDPALTTNALRAQEAFNPAVIVADPYSRAVATLNTFPQASRSVILPPEYGEQYDWKGDTWVIGRNHNDLVIYETHVRDLTAHPSSDVSEELRGRYLGMIEPNRQGGLAHLKRLGVNAVELLPVHEFNNIELPFGDKSTEVAYQTVNTTNPYEQNHWGYMTTCFFAPESYYATEQTLERGTVAGADGRAAKEMKDMVRFLHKEGIAVILDVVYNHTSHFDHNPLRFIDKMYYFRTEPDGRYRSASGCGNDFKSERRMARRMIVESVKFWMKEYHIDGFRFDLAALLDRATCEEITREARAINPNVILIAEPWGGGAYAPDMFSDLGWAAWNDRIRNGVKGQNPANGLGFIFGKYQGSNTKQTVQSFLTGTLREQGGLFVRKEHSISYLESHDDETMGDFIRLALGDASANTPVSNLERHIRLTPRQMALNKLAALFLCVTQGPIMLHSGQEYARTKVIAASAVRDPDVGKIDRNSYNKDNETNYINYRQAAINRDLIEYYANLIALRRQYPRAFGSATLTDITFLATDDDFVIAFRVNNSSANAAKGAKPQRSALKISEPKSFVVVLNGNPHTDIPFTPPAGKWAVLANAERVAEPGALLGTIVSTGRGGTLVKRTSGLILAEE